MNLPATLSVSLFFEVVYGDDHPPCEKTIRSHCANGEIPGASPPPPSMTCSASPPNSVAPPATPPKSPSPHNTTRRKVYSVMSANKLLSVTIELNELELAVLDRCYPVGHSDAMFTLELILSKLAAATRTIEVAG